MLQEIFIEFPRRVFHAPVWDTKRRDSEKSKHGDCNLCYALEDKKQIYGFVGNGEEVFGVAANTKPYAPGHALLIYKKHVPDIYRLDADAGKKLFETLSEISEVLGRSYWLFANVGWVAGQSYAHFHVHVLPDPWHIDNNFAEEVEDRRTFDPLTDVIMDGVRDRKFYIRYGDAHMTAALLPLSGESFIRFKRVIGEMRTQFGKMREVLYQQRREMLDRGKVPSLGYHLLVLNYDEPQLVVIPRVFVPKEGRWAVLELLYNADLFRDLHGDAEHQFWNVANQRTEEIIRKILQRN